MDWMMMMLLMGNGRQLDRERLRTWAMNDRKEKMETYAKISRGLAFGAYYVYSSLKLKVKTAAGEVDATDSTVSSTAKQNATLAGIQELYRATALLVADLRPRKFAARRKRKRIDRRLAYQQGSHRHLHDGNADIVCPFGLLVLR